MNILAKIQKSFESVLGELIDSPEKYLGMIRPSQDPKFGDYQANFAMPLSKELGKPPRDIASEVIDKIDVSEFCEDPEVAGPGFINLKLKSDWLVDTLRSFNTDERLGVEKVESPRKYIVDYSAPNVAKPAHVGHLRSTVIGNALYRILQFLGHDVTSDNHIGDWGTQFGMIIYGYKNFLDEQAYEKKPVDELARLYRLVNQLGDYQGAVESLPVQKNKLEEMKKALTDLENEDSTDKSHKKKLKKAKSDVDSVLSAIKSCDARIDSIEKNAGLKALADAHPGIAEKARLETAKLHSGDQENIALWEKFIPHCLETLQEMYDRLDISFDMALGESFYQPRLGGVVDSLKETGLATESEGAVCVFHESNEAPFIVRKSDGAFTYATTDLATVEYRVNELKADCILYVVDSRQGEHFKLLFETARAWGYDSVEFHHVNFGTILGEDKRPYKTRSGDVVGLESLLDEAVTRARQIVDTNDDARENPELDDSSRAEVAETVGIGGIKYADLHHNRESDYVFSWDKMLSVTGDTATYMQYSYARINGIFRKGNIDLERIRKEAKLTLESDAERNLAIQILQYSEILDQAIRELKPNILTDYLFGTANSFSTFYEKCPVLKEEDEAIRDSRLFLCDLTARILKHGLSLLGIKTSEKM